MTPHEYQERMRETAPYVLAYAKKMVLGRLDLVVLFARAVREAMDELSPEERGLTFVVRTWDLPALSPSGDGALTLIRRACRNISSGVGRVILLSYAADLALDELSPDEQGQALAAATRIIRQERSCASI